MTRSMGIDVGSTTVKIAVLDKAKPVFTVCQRHRGRAQETLEELLEKAPSCALRGVTGSLGMALAEQLGAVPVHEVRVVVRAVRAMPELPATVVEVGGQDAKMIRFDADRVEMQMNDRCAAGTGATLDRIARRLGIGSEALRSARLHGDLEVAARCGVFAETDLVNLVKRGASIESAIGALARAIVAQSLSVLARGRPLRPPVLLLGGPHTHLPVLVAAWREAVDGAVIVPENAEIFAAFGAAMHAASGAPPTPRVRGVLRSRREESAPRATERELGALRCAPSVTRCGPIRRVHLGIDAGSTTSKAVLLDQDGRLLSSSYGPSGGDPVTDAQRRLEELLSNAPHALVLSCGVTGYGAELLGPALGADVMPTETVAHAAAARHEMSSVDVVVDVGGTDVKIVQLDGGRVLDFFSSNQCAAGHGAFLAASANDLGVPLAQFAELALAQSEVPRFTIGCAVFMDTDRVTFAREGYPPGAILAGLAAALPRNIWEHMVPRPPAELGRRFLLTGGVHRNLAVAFAHSSYLKARISDVTVRVHPHPELCGAIGASLVAARSVRHRPSTFVGFEHAAAVRVQVRRDASTRCGRCEVGCERSLVSLGEERGDEQLVLGNACERGSNAGSTVKRTRAHAPDLLYEEAQRIFRPLLSRPEPRVLPKRVVFGVPRVMGLYRSAPLILHYLRAAGVPDEDVVLTPPTSAGLVRDGAQWGAHDPCFPSKLVLSHVDALLRADRRIDALLMPALTHAKIAPQGTADTASCPIVAASGMVAAAAFREELARRDIRPLMPTLCVLEPARLEGQLFAAFGKLLGLDESSNRTALEYALRAQRAFSMRCQRRGRAVLARVRRQGRAAAVVLARPYHADPGVQHGISTELASRGIPVLTILSLPTEQVDVGPSGHLLTNSGCAEKLWAARVVCRTPHLVAVDISSFLCGQDAAILGPLGDALASAKRPALRLHDLDEDRPGASLRLRIDTFVESVRDYERIELHAEEMVG